MLCDSVRLTGIHILMVQNSEIRTDEDKKMFLKINQ